MLGAVVEVEGSAREEADLSLCAHDARRVPDHLEKPGFAPEYVESHTVRASAPDGDIGLNATYNQEDAVACKLESHGAAKGFASAEIEIRNNLISDEASRATRADEVCGWVPSAVASLNEGSSW